jgi:hypothetical protein
MGTKLNFVSTLIHEARCLLPRKAGLLTLAIVSTSMGVQGADVKRFDCTILSDQQKGTVIKFDTASRLLSWRSAEPTKMVLKIEKDRPLEIVAVSEEQVSPRHGLRIWAEGSGLRFLASAGDSLVTGTCEPH